MLQAQFNQIIFRGYHFGLYSVIEQEDETRMSKRIVFCADGTWDSPAEHTNVYKLYKALLVTATQIPFYDDGVGADGNPISKVLGGAFGTGLWQKIKDGYAKIAHVYEAGDQLFLFGFSRGAYTARSLAGMISACGLPTTNFTDDIVDIAFKAYRDKADRQNILSGLTNFAMDGPNITMAGVWDTVGSLGIPAAIGLSDPIAYGFLDTSLSPKIQNAYHALAIDEKRAQFPPTLWTSQPAPGQTMEQVWFVGVHSDVGGGEPDDTPGTTALSDITLGWMMSKASGLGLQFDPNVLAQYQVPLMPEYSLDTLHASWNILWGLPRERSIANNATLANSVKFRCMKDSSYRPEHLTFENDVLSALYGITQVVQEL